MVAAIGESDSIRSTHINKTPNPPPRAPRTWEMLSTAKTPPISMAEAPKRSRMWMGKKGPRHDWRVALHVTHTIRNARSRL